MQISDLLAQAGGLSSVARQLGIPEEQARQGAEALLPALLGGLRKQADTQPEGLGGLLGQLGGGLLDQVLGGGAAANPNPATTCWARSSAPRT